MKKNSHEKIKQLLIISIFIVITTNIYAQVNQINDTGNVGIGTLSPQEPLDVIGNASVQGDLEVIKNTNIGIEKEGIDTIQNKKNLILLTVYPNPTKGLIIIERPKNQEEIISIKIYNSEGVLIYNNNSIDCYSLTIDISAHPKGVYFFRATSGNNVFLEKIIYQ